MQALAVKTQQGAQAVAPLFRMDYALHHLHSGGPARRSPALVDRRFPPRLRLPMMGLVSPFAERCHFGFAPHLSADAKRQAANHLLDMLEQQAPSRVSG